jgi:Arc/MetJ-type ribon-helix-helix transcriptional regulator
LHTYYIKAQIGKGMKISKTKLKRVNITLSEEIYNLIDEEIVKKGLYLSIPEYIRYLIIEDLKKRGLLE